LIAKGPVPLRATVSIRDTVNTAKGDDLKQIVELPARIEYAVSGIDCYSANKYTIKPCEKQ
jgi:hypothetical protein